jgi:hypothetical protein
MILPPRTYDFTNLQHTIFQPNLRFYQPGAYDFNPVMHNRNRLPTATTSLQQSHNHSITTE